jgi:ankyrin repeat protein
MQSAGLVGTEDVDNVIEEARIKVKALLAVEEDVMLSKELAEALRWRVVTWSRIPPLMRKLALPFLTLKDTLRLDTAVSERGEEDERDHLIKAYKDLRSPGFDEWVFKSANNFAGLRWARKRGIDLRHLKLEYEGETDRNKVLCGLVLEGNEDLATYYAVRSDAKDVKSGETLLQALKLGYLTVVQCILERGTETVNKSDACGRTPLYMASSSGYLEIVKTLITAKAEVNKSNDRGETPLYWASFNGHLEVVKTLIAAKAEVNKSTAYGETPLHWASFNGHHEIVKTLIAAKAEVNKSNTYGETPLYRASQNGHHEIVKTLIAAKAEVNKSTADGETPLYRASRKGYLEIVKTLIAAKAEVNKSNDRGYTPLSIALANNRYEVAAMLREAGAHE